MQKLFSMLVAGSLVGATAMPVLACGGGGGGGCGMGGGGYGYGGGWAVASGKTFGRAPMLARTAPAAAPAIARGNKQPAAAPAVRSVAARAKAPPAPKKK